jgi:hypothetical protein
VRVVEYLCDTVHIGGSIRAPNRREESVEAAFSVKLDVEFNVSEKTSALRKNCDTLVGIWAVT